MRRWIAVLLMGFGGLSAATEPLSAAPFLEMSRSCSGERLQGKMRYQINDWNGRSRRALNEKVYDFSVDCDGEEKHIVELFLATLSSGGFSASRYRQEDDSLMKRTGTRRKSVKVADARCEQVPERVRTYPSDAEARRACRGSPMPMACELEYQGRDKWVTEMVERCYRAKYEMREVPRWKAFPFGYAPLPKGARIVNVRPRKVVKSISLQKPPRPDVVTTGSIPSSDGGPGFGTFLIFALLLGGAYFYFKGLGAPAPEGYRDFAKSRLGEGFDFGNSREEPKQEREYTREHSDGQERREYQKRHAYTKKSTFDPASGDLPTSREEAYILLNIDADTPIEVANKIYWAMARAWHVDGTTSDEDRKRREIKMKQLNAAKEFIVGKR